MLSETMSTNSMSENCSFEEMRAVMIKLASIPVGERQFYIEHLSEKMSPADSEKYKARLQEIFTIIDEAEDKFLGDKEKNG